MLFIVYALGFIISGIISATIYKANDEYKDRKVAEREPAIISHFIGVILWPVVVLVFLVYFTAKGMVRTFLYIADKILSIDYKKILRNWAEKS